MTRTSNRARQRPKSIKSPPGPTIKRSEPSIFFTTIHPPAVFPPDIIINPPRSNRTIAVPLPAVREPKSERLLVRKSENAPRKKDRKISAAPVQDISPKMKPALPTRKGRKAATGVKRYATKAQSPEPMQRLTPPTEAERTLPPVAANIIPEAGARAPTSPPRSSAVMPKHDTPTAPLPRSASVVTYQKNGPLAIMAFWLRSSGRKISGLFKTTPKRSVKHTFGELERLRIENLALRRRIDRLMSERQQA